MTTHPEAAARLLKSAREEAQSRIISMKTPQGIKSWKLLIDYPVKLANVRIVHGLLFMLLHVEGESALEL